MPAHEHPDQTPLDSTTVSTTVSSTAGSTPPSRGLAGRLLRSRAVVVSLAVVVLLAVAGTTLGYTALSKSVTVSVDGERREVTAMGGTVAEVLEAEGVEVGEHDLVAPALDTDVQDGTLINVRYGREVELTVDGDTTSHWVTSTDVASALGEIGASFQDARLSTSRGLTIDRGGVAVEVVTAKDVTFRLAGRKPVTRTVTALTVAEALRGVGVELDKSDETKPARGAQIEDGDRVVFTDVRVARKTVEGEEIDFSTVEREDDTMPEGETETVTEGRAGARDVVYRVVVRNGEVVQRREVSSKVTRRPVDAVVTVGTLEEAAPDYSGGGTVWDSLAQCESGGNWAINTGNGYYGGLQFSLPTWQAYGGSGLPSNNSREAQIAVAERVRAATGGYGSWPGCAAKLGLPR
ncbi:transglycosylase family protein [Nocardioides dongxiaopingii]|uniref:transglycosylase family protein n=1 Tax=Nocardioides dongxiaopingii TaxID=2576036 RepID=UPI0010C76AC4|nr:resuscitation-promoting factor [Nocardioides dongxiaopingii]